MNIVNIDHLLPKVIRPARYTGNEVNSISKDISRTGVRIALAFPDVYEIGMSHLGLKILHEILNELPGVAAERVYAPWLDMEEELRKGDSRQLAVGSQQSEEPSGKGIPLFSLESKTPMS